MNECKSIEIRSHFTDWHSVDAETARRYITFLLHNITAIRDEEKAAYIEANHLRGATVNGLVCGRA